MSGQNLLLMIYFVKNPTGKFGGPRKSNFEITKRNYPKMITYINNEEQ